MVKNKVIKTECGCVRYHDGNGQYHRENGPAIEVCNGDKMWMMNGQCHREDGPAVECGNGKKEYFLFDERIPVKKIYQEIN